MPSGSSPTLRWNSRKARSVATPNRLSSLPASNPQGVELALEGSNVVTTEVGRVEVQGAIAEPIARLDELPPRVGPDEPVLAQAPAGLEGPHGALGRRSVPSTELRLVDREIEPGQTLLDVADLGPLVSQVVDAHGLSLRRPERARQPSGRGRPWMVCALLRRRQMGLDLAEDGVLAASADDPSYFPPSAKRMRRGDAHDPVGASGGVVVHVQLGDRQRVAFVAADLLDHRRDHVARDAPVGPEVHQHGLSLSSTEAWKSWSVTPPIFDILVRLLVGDAAARAARGLRNAGLATAIPQKKRTGGGLTRGVSALRPPGTAPRRSRPCSPSPPP